MAWQRFLPIVGSVLCRASYLGSTSAQVEKYTDNIKTASYSYSYSTRSILIQYVLHTHTRSILILTTSNISNCPTNDSCFLPESVGTMYGKTFDTLSRVALALNTLIDSVTRQTLGGREQSCTSRSESNPSIASAWPCVRRIASILRRLARFPLNVRRREDCANQHNWG